MLKHIRLVNLWQDLELILNIWIVNLGTRSLKLKLSVTDYFLDDLLFNVGVAIWADAFDWVAGGKTLCKKCAYAFYIDLILKLNLTFSLFGKILRPFHWHRLGPAEEGAENWSSERLYEY